jgi:hypothetical protein
MTACRKRKLQSATLLAVLVLTFTLVGKANEGPLPAPSTDAIVQKLLSANARRAEALRSYRGKRAYTLDYRGFPGSRSADMAVEAAFTSPDKKEFKVVSQNGSKLLLNRVLLKLLDSEKEALQGHNRQDTELSPRNYEFAFLQMDRTPLGPAYVLQVKPRVNSKFLYRGKIWVDATDYAVARIEGEPAKNPSFWISRTRIEQRYGKFGEFWLPVHNQSNTHARLGGDAVLNIYYTDYQINESKETTAGPGPSVPIPSVESGDSH